MFHEKRAWKVVIVTDAADLVEKLHKHSWCLCAGFRLGNHLFLNDAAHEEGTQEYAVLKVLAGNRYRQIESWTVSWMELESLIQHVDYCLAGQLDDVEWGVSVTPVLQTPEEHGRCRFCA